MKKLPPPRMLLAFLALCLATATYSLEVAFSYAKSLKSGDEVEIVNPEFDNGYFGWEYEGNWFGQGSSNLFGNNCARMWEPHILKQTVTGLPDGTYLMQVCAFDADKLTSCSAASTSSDAPTAPHKRSW